MRVLIVQPEIPQYRLALFSGLARLPSLEITVVADETALTATALKETSATLPFRHRVRRLRPLPGRRLFWHTGVELNGMSTGDAIVLSGNPRYLSNIPLIVAARRRQVGVVWWGQGWSVGSRGVAATVRRLLMRFTDVVLLYTDREKAEYIARGFDPMRVFATNNALDQEPIREQIAAWSPNRLSEFRNANGLSQRRFVLFCSRLQEKVKLRLAVEALALLAQQGVILDLVVIGDGPDRGRLEEHAKAIGVANQIRWLGAIYEECALAPWFLTASCMVYPGAIGLSLMHAFGYGLPVVTHDNPVNHNPEFAALRHRENGLLFRENSIVDLAAQIHEVVRSPALRGSLAAKALETVNGEYSMDGMVRRFQGAVERAAELARARTQLIHPSAD